jgi:hypothetical protein
MVRVLIQVRILVTLRKGLEKAKKLTFALSASVRQLPACSHPQGSKRDVRFLELLSDPRRSGQGQFQGNRIKYR